MQSFRRALVAVTMALATIEILPSGLGKASSPANPNMAQSSSRFSFLLDFTFVDNEHGWALGAACAASSTCNSSGVRATIDGGRTWRRVGAPPAPPGWRGRAQPEPRSVHAIRFANLRHGWLYGPSLWSTRDAGASWQRDSQLARWWRWRWPAAQELRRLVRWRTPLGVRLG
jgi:photosystem II stability/assembly factor-like uncharacterized protein